MVYVAADGTVLEQRPWGFSRLMDAFWNTLNFITLFFKSLVGLDNGNAVGSGRRRGGSGGGPGNGPGGGGGGKRIGRITTMEQCDMPGGG